MSTLPDFAAVECHGYSHITPDERAAIYAISDTFATDRHSLQPLGSTGALVEVHFDIHPSRADVPASQPFTCGDILLEWVLVQGHRVEIVEFSGSTRGAWRAAIAAELNDAVSERKLCAAGL